MPELAMRGRRWFVLSMLVAPAVLAAPPALAQSAKTPGQLFDDGQKLLAAGRIAEACAAFEASQHAEPRVTTLLNLADCREQNHQLATALTLFDDAGKMATAQGNAKLAGVAANHVNLLQPRVSRLTIVVKSERRVNGLAVLRNSEQIAPADWGRALPVDGGSYTIKASAPGREPWSTTRTIKDEGDSQMIDIPVLTESRVASAAPRPTSPPVAPDKANDKPIDKPTDTSIDKSTDKPMDRVAPPGVTQPDAAAGRADTVSTQPSLVLPLAFGGGALALGGLALYFNHVGDKAYDEYVIAFHAGASNADSLLSKANTRRYAAEAFGAAAVVSLGVGVYFYVRGRSEGPPRTTAVAPVMSPGLAGLAVFGRW